MIWSTPPPARSSPEGRRKVTPRLASNWPSRAEINLLVPFDQDHRPLRRQDIVNGDRRDLGRGRRRDHRRERPRRRTVGRLLKVAGQRHHRYPGAGHRPSTSALYPQHHGGRQEHGPRRRVDGHLPRHASGRAADRRGRRSLFDTPVLRRERYDLSAVGRVKMNMRLDLDAPDTQRTLRRNDIIACRQGAGRNCATARARSTISTTSATAGCVRSAS